MRTRRIGQWAAVGVTAVATSVAAGFFAPGTDNSWDISGATSAMTDQGGGIWTYAVTGQAPGARLKWNIVATAGDWGSQVYTSDQWGYADGAGGITLTLDTNTYNDGWLPTTNRTYTDTADANTWRATGDWVDEAGLGADWDLANAPLMNPIGGGIFELSITGIPAGTYSWKSARTPIDGGGEWDGITDDNSTTAGPDNSSFTSNGPADLIVMQVRPSDGTVRVIPTPGALALIGFGGLAATRRRRR